MKTSLAIHYRRQAEAELLKKDKEIQSWRDSRDGIMAENETLVAAKLEAEAELSSLREKMKGIEEVYSAWKGTPLSYTMTSGINDFARDMWQAITQAVEGK